MDEAVHASDEGKVRSGMKRTQILGLALFAVFAFGAIAAASAFASPEWLVNGTTFSGSLNAETEGLLALIKTVSSSNKEVLNKIDCEGIFDGTITFPATDQVTEVLNLAKEPTGLAIPRALSCTVTFSKEAADCKLNSLAEVWPINLPWNTDIELMTNGTILDLFLSSAGKEPGYEVRCETGIFGIHIEESCTGASSALLKNEATTPESVDGLFNEESEVTNCSGTGEGTGAQEGLGNTWAIEGTLVRLATAVN